MTGSFLSIDFEDFAHDLQHNLGVEKPTTRPDALRLAVERIMKIVRAAPGSNSLTFFSTGQVARDHGEILRRLADEGHEVGCHGYYHDNIHQMGREGFAKALDDAIEVLGQSSGQPVYGFRAPDFSIHPEDDWAYEELAKRFLYDSSWVSETRDRPKHTTDLKIFGEDQLIEFPVFSSQVLPWFNARVIGGTYLKILPLGMVMRLMHRAVEEGFLPLIYLHPYEFLDDGEFWVKHEDLPNVSLNTRAYWQIRQHQWLSFGNRGLIRKLVKILKAFPLQGTMSSHILA